MLLGAQGNISVVANIAPRLMHEMCEAALQGDLLKARDLNFRLLGLHRQLFCEAKSDPCQVGVSGARADQRGHSPAIDSPGAVP